jgi:predicted adenine nucleotide alpha hydrolase (AANH) superfamily ATPase
MDHIKSKINYSKKLEEFINDSQKKDMVPALFLHSCCAPCSSYVLEYLSEYFSITDFYYNPNITPQAEFSKRESELKRLIEEQPHHNKVNFIHGKYEPEVFF